MHKTALAAREELMNLAASHSASPLKGMQVDQLTVKNGMIMPAAGSGQQLGMADLMRLAVRDTLPDGASDEDRRTFSSFKLMQPPASDRSIYPGALRMPGLPRTCLTQRDRHRLAFFPISTPCVQPI